jgi:hypothetical protein
MAFCINLFYVLLTELFCHQAFPSVSVLFCELAGLNQGDREACMKAVTTMNAAFSSFDKLMDQHGVYKVLNLV